MFLQLNKLRPEFRSGLDAFTKFVFERTRPKQVGATVMTGPILVGITESYLDALNHGAVPTITSSWQASIPYELLCKALSGNYFGTFACKKYFFSHF